MSSDISSFTTDVTLVGRLALDYMQKRLVLGRLATRSYSGIPTGGGDKVSIPDLTVAGSAATRAIGGEATASDVTSVGKTLTFQQAYKAVRVENLEALFSSVDLIERLAQELGYAVADFVDAQGAALFKEIPYQAGELDGTAAFNSTDKLLHLATGLETLSNNKVPDGPDALRLVLCPAEVKAVRGLADFNTASAIGGAVLAGELGRPYGVRAFESQNIQTGAATGTADTAGEIDGTAAMGATTVHIDGLAAADTIAAGTTITIENHSIKYVTTAAVTLVGNEADFPIWPPLQSEGTDGLDVTIGPVHSQAHSENLLFHPSALMLLTRRPAPLPGGVVESFVNDPQTGLGIRIAMRSSLLGGAGTAYTTEISADTVTAWRAIRPEWAVRITGD
jgi:hypothetical protein